MKGIYIDFSARKAKTDYSERVSSIRQHFGAYLNDYPAKTSRSKHGLLGPIGTVLREAKSQKWDAEGLAGYALSIHSNNPKTRGWIEHAALAELRAGVTELLSLVRAAPVGLKDGLIADIDYGLYLDRREAGVTYLHEVKTKFTEFARNKYKSGEQAAKAWGVKADDIGSNFEKMPYPSKNRFKTEPWGQDLQEFASQIGEPEIDDADAEDDL